MHAGKTRSPFLGDGRERPHRPFGRFCPRKGGVAPAHRSVLPACKSLAFILRIWLFLLCLSFFGSESQLETCAESLWQRLRHLRHSGPRDSACNAGLKKGGLTVDEFGSERGFLLGREVAEFRSDHV